MNRYGVVENHPESCSTEEHYYKGCAVHESHPRWWEQVLYIPIIYVIGISAIIGFFYGIYRLLIWLGSL